jgi:hypothetical protein
MIRNTARQALRRTITSRIHQRRGVVNTTASSEGIISSRSMNHNKTLRAVRPCVAVSLGELTYNSVMIMTCDMACDDDGG